MENRQLVAMKNNNEGEEQDDEEQSQLWRRIIVHGDSDIVVYLGDYLSLSLQKQLIDQLSKVKEFKQDVYNMYGREVKSPRLVVSYADQGITYSYTGQKSNPLPWPEWLLPYRRDIERISQQTFNYVLINQYRSGQDSIGWHSDNENDIMENSIIASLSLGVTRTFLLRKKNQQSRSNIASVELESGSLLLMKPPTQSLYQHSIPKQLSRRGIRFNLTFRWNKGTSSRQGH